MKTVNLNDNIADVFSLAVSNIVNCDVDLAVLKGGRASTKSTVAAISIIVGTLVNKESSLCVVKYNNRIRDRLVNTFSNCMDLLGVREKFKLHKSPYEYVLLDNNGAETNCSIMFFGADSPENLKSLRSRQGGFRYLWVEETSNFENENDLLNLQQTIMRGMGDKCIIYSYNPPLLRGNWLNKKFNVIPQGYEIDKKAYHDQNYLYLTTWAKNNAGIINKLKILIHTSTYLDIAKQYPEWLGTSFINQAEITKKHNINYYNWIYLGIPGVTEANVFSNVKDWNYKQDVINGLELFRGLDFSNGGKDPNALVVWAYDRKNKNIYGIGEHYRAKESIDDLAFACKELNKNNFEIFGDSAVPILINQLVERDCNVVPVKKKPDSIRAGIKWLQSLNGIYIDKVLTPNTYREFNEYSYKIDKNDEVTNELQDDNNHTIDASRYAFSDLIRFND